MFFLALIHLLKDYLPAVCIFMLDLLAIVGGVLVDLEMNSKKYVV